MTNDKTLIRIKKLLKSLSQFQYERKEDEDGYSYDYINDKYSIDYENDAVKKFKTINKLLNDILEFKEEKISFFLIDIYYFYMGLSWKMFKNYELHDAIFNGYEEINTLYAAANKYTSYKDLLSERLERELNKRKLQKVGITLSVSESKLSECLEMLIKHNKVRKDTNEEAFIKAFTGRVFYQNIIWKNPRTICLFFKGLKHFKFKGSYLIDENNIYSNFDWIKISEVFPETREKRVQYRALRNAATIEEFKNDKIFYKILSVLK